MTTRCGWLNADPLYIDYHDREWGVPLHDDGSLFELLILEGAQAGLSWWTILNKRERYRQVFDQFDPQLIARYDERKLEELMSDKGIVRNRLKICGAVRNAQAFLEVREKFGSFDAYIWRFVDGRPKLNSWQSLTEVPASTAESDAMSRDLTQRGFTFVGPTICYAFMQAAGMVNDHTADCFRHQELCGKTAIGDHGNDVP
ncbi:DNA-3-methyladenine glycosylase I [Ferviditalea candida]|uniref:DNA-3-methyladenine glycosylase I n=1 Tax=Ferviditalea candida TaxID=3108399 RepID=A0ABU5ZE08_9BACL|nr:DNA-3-methyladenine glycosylase I [Paenibacillaceae bacterium T2]